MAKSPIWKYIKDDIRHESMPEKRQIKMKPNYRLIAFAALAIVIVFFLYSISRQFFWTALFTIVGVTAKFFRTRLNIPVEIEPVFFFSVLLTREYSLAYGLFLEALAVIGINIINVDMSQSWIVGLIKPALVLVPVALFSDADIVLIGVTMSIVRSILGLVMGLAAGVPISAMVFVPLNPLINIAYFLNLGRLLEALL
jgi:hypothetical protein